MRCFGLLAAAWIVGGGWASASGAADAPASPALVLFDGRTLAGWHVIGCEAIVENGTIHLKSGNGVVRTDSRYTEFVLELDWKALKAEAWDSGIYFRCELPSGSRPWPKQYQVNLRQGMEGNVQELPGASSTGLVKTGDWNHFKLTVLGTRGIGDQR